MSLAVVTNDESGPVLRDDARRAIVFTAGSAFAYLLIGVLELVLLLRYGDDHLPREVLGALQWGSFIQIALFALAAINWLVWQRRVSLRVRAAGHDGLRFTPGWSIGWYFVPLANFVMPPQVMQELWQASDSSAGPSDWKASSPNPRIQVWWSVFIIGNLISRAGIGAAAAGQNAAWLVTDVVSTVFAVSAAILAMRLLWNIEVRTSTLESIALSPEIAAPKTMPALAGAALGAVAAVPVAAAWYCLMSPLLRSIGLGVGYWTAVPMAVVMGAIVAAWTLMGAGVRTRTAVGVAAVAGLLAVPLGNLLVGGPPQTFFAFLVRNPVSILVFVFRSFVQPISLVLALTAAGAGAGFALVKLPLRRSPQAVVEAGEAFAPAPLEPYASIEVPAPVAPPVTTVPMPIAPSAAITVEPVGAAAPEPAPLEVTAPTVEPAESFGVVAAAELDIAQPSRAAKSRAWFPEGLRANRTFVFGLLAGVVLVAVIIGVFALGRASAPKPTTPSATPTPSTLVPAAVSDDAETGPENAMPEDVVRWLYEKAAAGDLDAARGAPVSPGVVEDRFLENWGTPDVEIIRTATGREDMQILVEVQEGEGGLPNSDVVTWLVRSEMGRWRIHGWLLGPIENFPEYEAAIPRIETEPGSTGFDGEKAKVTLAQFLQWRMVGDVSKMRSLATANMERVQPRLFDRISIGTFTEVTAVAVYQEGDAWVVKVREKWRSGTETHEYVVVEQQGKVLVDLQR